MVAMASMDEHERKIVIEFCHLLEKSKQLFNGLRDLPQYGHKQWQAYFGRTFDIYTKLWKFQQQHRQTLDTKYGLKRWQIGEIASKIGQLYYHYYLRTSETNYLNEAYSFYAAIRGRAYYSRASKEDRSDLMVKKLRYYARFIVVCLLLKKMKLVRELVIELDKQIADYTSTYEPDDQIEWSLVLEEIKSFIKADAMISVLHADSNPIVLSHRLSPLTTPPVEKSQFMNLTLQEILIIGNCTDQVKFSELTMDMFRMLQTLEREPQDDFNHIYDASPAPGRMPYAMPGSKCYPMENGDRPNKRENPHKYLLYKPSLSQVLVFLASGFKELPTNGALLLYISADGCFSTTKHPEDMGYDLGGVLTCSKRDGMEQHTNKKSLQIKEMHCLYPGDLYPFTRRPLFVIVDSDNSFVFQHIPRYFGQPLVTLMSPQDTPPAFQDQQHNGSLFTLFLHSPLTAFCFCCNLVNIPIHHWERCQSYIDRFVTEASRLFTRSRMEPSYLQFFGDDFLRLLLLRYIFCDVVLHLHRGFKGRQYRPRCQPPLPEAELLEHPALQHLVLDLAAHLEMEYGIWNFPGGLWTANNLAAFNGATLTPIPTALPTNTASFAITAGLLNPIITAAAACNINLSDPNDIAINSDFGVQSEEHNSEESNSSKFTEICNNDEDEIDDDEGSLNNNNTVINNGINQTSSSEYITTSDLSSNSSDDNAVDNSIKISNSHQIQGYLAQQYAPVYNLVLGHFSNQNVLEASETEESSDDENTNTINNNENFASNDSNNYSKQLLNDHQPSISYETSSTNTPSVSEQFTNTSEIHRCPVAGCEFKTTHIDILEQHVTTHGEKSGKNKKISNMQRIRYEREEYHCSMCTYTCTTEKAYLRHLRMHSMGETPHGRLSCAVCGRDRVGETAMAKHMRKHRDGRFFCCDICVFRTVQLKKLIQHRRMHTGEKPHLCPHCAYRSARRDNLRSHVRRVHKRDNLWCDTFSPRGMLLTPSISKNKDSDTSLPPTENKVKTIDK